MRRRSQRSAPLVTATNRREIYDAALGAAGRLTREGHEVTLFELSDEALSPVAATGLGSREALYLAAMPAATLEKLRAGEQVETDGAILLPLAVRGAPLGASRSRPGPRAPGACRSSPRPPRSRSLESAALTEDSIATRSERGSGRS